jgi:hypothetical protein
MTEINRSELEWLILANARTDAITTLVARDIERARAVAARAGRVAEELWDRVDVAKERDVHEALRLLNTAVYLSSASRALEREIKYHSPERPCCV